MKILPNNCIEITEEELHTDFASGKFKDVWGEIKVINSQTGKVIMTIFKPRERLECSENEELHLSCIDWIKVPKTTRQYILSRISDINENAWNALRRFNKACEDDING